MKLSKVISAAKDTFGNLIVKVLRMGRSDVQTAMNAGPYGVDSHPVKDAIAIFAQTGVDGEKVILGYINKNQLAQVGEYRTFSTDADGVEVFYTYMKNDGTMEVGGNSDFMVRFNELKTGFDQLKSDFNNHVTNVYGTHVHGGVTAGGGTSGTTTTPGTTSSASIDSAKIDEIKCL